MWLLNKHIIMYATVLVLKEMQNKTMIRYYNTLNRLSKTEKD